MELVIRNFSELSVSELYEIYRLRSLIFVVEQNCPYNDVDELDPISKHIFLRHGDQIIAYLRLIPDANGSTAHIGRVLAVHRRQGHATMLLKEVLDYCKTIGLNKLYLSAQVYAKELYEKLGFTISGDSYLLDDIPHIDMELFLS